MLHYNFTQKKTFDLYASRCDHFTALPKNANTNLLITTTAQQLIATKTTLVAMRMEMLRLAKQLPEYDIGLAMYKENWPFGSLCG
ncbi:hypothetical protein CE91St46_08280 [Eubacteriales bacterium]|nr:hypothetical protein CE91St46_08280 [Eubacteriales bacterium]GKH62359.1 hypothetical protein CE91St47_08280 [Eubacteriales bacterium]